MRFEIPHVTVSPGPMPNNPSGTTDPVPVVPVGALDDSWTLESSQKRGTVAPIALETEDQAPVNEGESDMDDSLHDDEELWEEDDLEPHAALGEVEEDPAELLENTFPDWCSFAMWFEQRKNPTCVRMRSWLEDDHRPSPQELDGEGQEVGKMCAIWNSMCLKNEVVCRRSKFGLQAVVPAALRVRIFQHLHANPVQGGHLGRNRMYSMIQERS